MSGKEYGIDVLYIEGGKYDSIHLPLVCYRVFTSLVKLGIIGCGATPLGWFP